VAARYVIGRDPVVLSQASSGLYLSHVFLLGYSQLNADKLLVPAWSLDLEAQFYLIAPLVVALACGRRWMQWGLVLVAGAACCGFSSAPTRRKGGSQTTSRSSSSVCSHRRVTGGRRDVLP
jgi:peptidoglycan/LPS O-acetylase OafA/YrhL